jgi:hypothetical protein
LLQSVEVCIAILQSYSCIIPAHTPRAHPLPVCPTYAVCPKFARRHAETSFRDKKPLLTTTRPVADACVVEEAVIGLGGSNQGGPSAVGMLHYGRFESTTLDSMNDER